MFEEYINRKVKLVYKDGSNIVVKTTIFLDYKDNFVFLEDTFTKVKFAVNSKDINKIEVLQ